MRIAKCDKCGNEIDYNLNNLFYGIAREYGHTFVTNEKIDLCSDCEKKIIRKFKLIQKKHSKELQSIFNKWLKK